MARNRKVSTDNSIEKVNPPPSSVDLSLEDPTPSDEPETPQESVEPPALEKYKVVSGGWVFHGSFRVYLKPGKVVTSGTFDITLLKKEGIELERIEG